MTSHGNSSVELHSVFDVLYYCRRDSMLCRANNIFGFLLNLVVLFVGIALNCLVLACFQKSPFLRNKVPYVLINVLSWTDLVTVIVVHPLFALLWFKQLQPDNDIDLGRNLNTATIFMAGLSNSTLFIMNLERYVAVFSPFFYDRHITRARLVKSVLTLFATWTITWLFVLAFHKKSIASVSLAFTLLFVLTSVAIYVRIFSASRTPLPAASQTWANAVPGTDHTTRLRRYKRFLFNFKLSKTYLFVGLTLLGFYLPQCITSILRRDETIAHSDVFYVVEIWSVNVLFLASSANSFVFFWRNRVLRDKGRAMLKIGISPT